MDKNNKNGDCKNKEKAAAAKFICHFLLFIYAFLNIFLIPWKIPFSP